MTENEKLISFLERMKNLVTARILEEQELEIIIKALEENQAYRAIGTIEEFKALKDAEEQGLLLRLPCKVGDVIYEINNGKIVEHCLRAKWRIVRYMEEGIFGVLAFTTREEAEQALEAMKGGAE